MQLDDLNVPAAFLAVAEERSFTRRGKAHRQAIAGLSDTDLKANVKKRASHVAADLLNGAPSASTLAAIERGVEGSAASSSSLLPALVIGSPDFQRR
jgi:hypothetical protein